MEWSAVKHGAVRVGACELAVRGKRGIGEISVCTKVPVIVLECWYRVQRFSRAGARVGATAIYALIHSAGCYEFNHSMAPILRIS